MLTANETEAVTQFKQKGLQPRDKPVFEFPLFHGLAQSQKIQAVGTLEHFICLFGKVLRQCEIKVVTLLLCCRPFVGTCFDLV
jgi:hypothetical protein